MCYYVHCSVPLWMPFYFIFSLHSHPLPICNHRAKSNRCFQGHWSETSKHSFDCLWFFGSNRDFSCPLLKGAPWKNFSLLEWREEYKVLVLWCVLPVCVQKKKKHSAIWELWVTDSWWLYVKLLKTCLAPQHFCVYVSVLTSPIGHVSDYDQSASAPLAGAMLPPSPPTPTQNLYTAPLYHSIFWSAAASERAAIRGGSSCMALWHMTSASALIRFL